MSSLIESIETLHTATIESDSEAQQTFFQQIDLDLSEVGEVPDNVFNALLLIMEDKKVLSSENSASLFKLFEYNHDLLTDEQRASLWTRLCEAFPKLIDPSSLILVAELAVSLCESPHPVLLPVGEGTIYAGFSCLLVSLNSKMSGNTRDTRPVE